MSSKSQSSPGHLSIEAQASAQDALRRAMEAPKVARPLSETSQRQEMVLSNVMVLSHEDQVGPPIAENHSGAPATTAETAAPSIAAESGPARATAFTSQTWTAPDFENSHRDAVGSSGVATTAGVTTTSTRADLFTTPSQPVSRAANQPSDEAEAGTATSVPLDQGSASNPDSDPVATEAQPAQPDPINAPPTITSAMSAAIAENSTGPVYIATATDPDAGTTLTYALSGADAALFDINAQTGEVTFKSSPDYETPRDADGDNVYDVKVSASDGTNVVSQDVAITVGNSYEGPVITSAAAAAVTENATGPAYTAAGDADAGATLTYALSGADAALFDINAQTGEVTFKSSPDYETPRDADGDNVYDVKVSATDGTSTATQNVAITVGNSNEGPTITSAASAAVTENSTGTVYTAAATDPDAGTTLTYALSGADAALFDINAQTGEVTFKSSPDYETPRDADGDNVYDVKVSATDGTNTASQDVAITVGNSNEGPTITSAVSAAVTENGTGPVYTVAATDPDAGATLTYSLSGSDAALFDINAQTGEVTFKSSPDYETPRDADGDNVYDIKVSASDGTSTATQDVAVTVANSNEGPTITSAASAAVTENGTGPVYTAAATDPDASTTLTYALSGADAALFDINAQTGEVTFKSSPDFETPRDADGDNVYDVKVSATDGTNTATQDVAITVGNSNEGPTVTSAVSAAVTENSTGTVYTAAATDPDAGTTLTYALSGTDAALFNINAQTGEISFKQGPDFEAAKDAGGDNVYDVKVTASDGTTAATQDVKISVTNTNEGPTITSAAAATVAENTSGVIYMAAATDPDAGTKLSYTLSGNDAALFKIDAQTGEVSFKGAPDYEKPRDASGDNVYDIKVSASDGTTTTTQNVAVTVANVDEGFKVTSDKAISVEENTTGTVYTATAFNEAGGTITYSMSGTDAGRFTINQATGAVAFKTAPDYELPTDVGGNNVYDIKVSATDGKDTVTQDVAISVTDGSEQPILTSATSVNVTENTTGTVYTITSNAPNVTYSLSGADAALFNINEKTGAVSFKVSPDYENAQDAGRNNGYDIVVHASTSGAGANLLVNGSFEADVLAGQTQQRTSLTGWSSLSGDFELWRNYADLLPDVGSQNIELDAGTKTDGIYQDVNTTAGQQYVVSLATMIRPGNTVATAGVEVLWNGVVIGTVSPGQSWADSSFEVFGTGGADRLTIKEPASQGADTGGPLIDNVRLFIPADDENSRSQPVHISLTDVQGTTKDGTSGADTLTGAADNDTLYGLAGADTLRGGAGDDTLIGGAGADKLEGGAGKDTASYETASSAVTANLKTTTGAVGDAVGDTFNSIEHLTGSGFNDTLTGSDVDNILSGGAGVDKIYGGWGYDTLIGGAGADYLDGQQSGDTASYIDSDAAVTINLQTGVVTGGYATGDTLVSIEDLAGSNFNDSLTGNAAANIIEGGRGADALDGGAGLDTLSYQNSGAGVTINMATGAASGGDATGDTFVNFESVQGSRHADDLTGNSGNNALYGGEGDDKLTGGAGADILDGGRGSDTASYATASSGVTTHLALGGTGGDATGDSYFGVENLEGSAFNDTLSGDAGNNIITGGAGADIMDGGNGVNTLSYETSGSGVSINLMTGAASGGDAAGDVFSRFQNVTGSSHADTLAGDAGSNVLHGGAGDDILSGGRGNDTLYGDAGADLFIMNVGDGVDTVYGGAGGSWMDSIELRDASGGSYTGGFPTDWTMVLTAGHVTGSTQDSLDLSADASGYLENNDGTRVNFAEIEQIRW